MVLGEIIMDMRRLLQILLLLVFVGLTLAAGCNMLGSFRRQAAKEGVINVSGRIEGDEYNVGSKTSGKVERILVDEGSVVKKGELIGTIYSEQLRAQLDSAKKDVLLNENRITQAETALEQAQAHTDATVRQATANLQVNNSQLNKARASQSVAEAELERSRLLCSQAQLEYEQALANLRKAKADLDYNEKEYTRVKNLLKEDAVAKARYDAVENRYIAAREELVLARRQVDKAVKNIESSKRSVNVAEANVAMATAGIHEGESVVDAGQANVNLAGVGKFDVESRLKDVSNARREHAKALDALRSAKADLEDSKVFSPVDGVIMSKIAEPGEVISGGTPLVTVVNMDSLYLRVYVPTSQQGRLKIGNPVTIVPDSFDGKEGRQKKEFKGSVYKISEKAEFTPKNVETKEQRAKLVFSIKIRFEDNSERLLKPGMPCEAWIDTTKAQ